MVVKVQEAEAGLVTDREICDAGMTDGDVWEPARALFGRPPWLAVGPHKVRRSGQRAGGDQRRRPSCRAVQTRQLRHGALGHLRNDREQLPRPGPGGTGRRAMDVVSVLAAGRRKPAGQLGRVPS